MLVDVGPAVNDNPPTRPTVSLDEPREQLVGQQAAARREPEPRPVCVERLQQPGVERPVQVRGEGPVRRLGRRQAGVQPQREDDRLGRGGIARRCSSEPPGGSAGSAPSAGDSAAGTRPAGPRSSGGPRRRTRARPARPPRTGAAASRRGCAGSRARAGPSSRSRSPGSPPRRAGRPRARTGRRPGRRPGRGPPASRQRRAPDVVGRWSPSGPVMPSASGSSSVSA